MIQPRRILLRSSKPEVAARWDWEMTRWDACIWCDARTLRSKAVSPDGRVIAEWDDPLRALEWVGRFESAGDSGASARWVGYLSYDAGRLFERLPAIAVDDLGVPLFAFVLTRGTGGAGSGRETPATGVVAHATGSTFTRRQYERAVSRAIEYIAAGDVFQVNLSQRFEVRSPLPADAVFQRLQAAGGAHYGGLLDFEDFAVVSASPELFLRVTPHGDGTRAVVTRPMKGTRPRSAGMDEALRRSAKDQAELNMIVDLERNDLGRVCEIGSVRVTEPRTIEAHPTVYQGVAQIEGELRQGVGLLDLLRATFPSGSVTGAPKIRAMEIIDELEPVRRGPYCGAVGYIGADGSIEFNVAIRTMLMKDGVVQIPVGGGVVADSVPADEYDETLVKARAMFAALGVVAPE